MVKQTQKDALDILIGSGSDLSELLTPDREVIGFQALRDLDMESMDFLTDDIDPLSDDLCGGIHIGLDQTIEVGTDIVVDGEVAFDPTETSYDTLDISSVTPTSSSTEYIFTYSLSPSAPEVNISEKRETETEVPVSPLTKMDLKNKIRQKRIAEGKGDIHVVFEDPEPEKLTEEEEEKRKVRREKNKLAAQKCRSKKRKMADTLEEQTEKLEEKREKLTNEVMKLKEERDHLMEIIKVHSVVCPEMAHHVCGND